MEKSNNEFSGLIGMINSALLEEDTKGVAVREYGSKVVYGEMMGGFIEHPYELELINKENICQQLYDALQAAFGEQLCPGYSHSFGGEWNYFMTLGDNVMIFFPEGYEHTNWVYNQVQKDNEAQRAKEGKTL